MNVGQTFLSAETHRRLLESNQKEVRRCASGHRIPGLALKNVSRQECLLHPVKGSTDVHAAANPAVLSVDKS